MPLRISTPKVEGTLQGSKALKHQFLLDSHEMSALFEHLSPFFLYNVSQPCLLEEALLSDFLAQYTIYVEGMKQGNLIDEKEVRPYFSALMTADCSMLYAQEVGGGKVLIRSLAPALQLQAHHFSFNKEQRRFFSLVMGRDRVSWGIQISYPQLYQDPKTQEVRKVERSAANSCLFQALSRWLRSHTLPTPFLFEGERFNASIRLGKQCFAWIDRHPQLKPLKIYHGA